MAQSRRWYVSLEAVKASMGFSTTANDANLKRMIDRASVWLEQQTGRVFIPVTRTVCYDCPADVAGDLVLHDDLLALSTLTDGAGAWLTSEYILYPLWTGRASRIRPVGRYWSYTDTPYRAVTVGGRWGYSEQTEATGTVLAAAITTTTATTFTVTDGTLIETGWCLLIDTEQVWVSAVTGATITCQRGNGGTTAATHSNGATVYRYVPTADAEAAVGQLTTVWHLWAEAEGVASKSVSTGGYSVSFGGQWDVPQAVKDMMAALRRPLVTTVY